MTARPGYTVTWWGHATTTIEDGGVRVLTDPVFTRRLAHLSRRGGAVPEPAARAADLVVLSHLHADHLHRPSLALLPAGSRVLVPAGGAVLLAGLGLRIREVVAGDEVDAGGGVTVRAVPARHDGRRTPVSRLWAAPLGYVVQGTRRTYFPGDTEWYDGMGTAVGPVDTVLAPVGGWGPTLGAGHLGPPEAAAMVAELRPSLAVPVHYGTFWPAGLAGIRDHLFHAPGLRFAAEVAAAGVRTRVAVLDHGTALTVADPGTAAAGSVSSAPGRPPSATRPRTGAG